jgi:hypothetical protein
VKRLFWALFAAAVLFAGGYAYDRFWRAPTEEELSRLRQERRFLNGRLEKRLSEDFSLIEAREASVIVGVPVRFAERFAGELARSLFSEVRVTLRNLEVRKEGELRGRILVGARHLGTYTVTVAIEEVVGILRAGKPKLRFEGDRVAVVLPVSLAEGSGRGRIRFQWDGRGVAGVVCGDVDVSGVIVGSVVPDAYTLRGSLSLATDGPTLVARPTFEDAEIRLGIEPSTETWQLVEKTIGEQGALCRAALRAANVPEKLRAVVQRGFPVKLPRKLFPEMRLPVELERSADLEGRVIHVQVRPAGLTLTPARIWYGADVRLEDNLPAPAEEAVPEEAVPQEAVPDEARPDEGVPEEAAPPPAAQGKE